MELYPIMKDDDAHTYVICIIRSKSLKKDTFFPLPFSAAHENASEYKNILYLRKFSKIPLFFLLRHIAC